MLHILADIVVQTTTTTQYGTWVDAPEAVALMFGLAGAFFLGIYLLRRKKKP